MREAIIKRMDGEVDRVSALEVSDFPFFQIPDITRHAKHKKVSYLKTFATFDIEASTYRPDPDDAPQGFMYHWQMDIGGVVVYGRRWEEWLDLMREISEWLELNDQKRMVVYIHNASYEFEFIRNFLNEDMGGFEVFAIGPRKPIYIFCGWGFEFRCSYQLTNMNLYKATINELGVIHPKAKSDLDYDTLRTADTYMDDQEFGYCISDVVSLYEVIENRLKNEGDTLDTIPLTSTGYVRRECRRSCRQDKRYRDRVFKKQRMDADVYTLLKEAGRGGNTHANRYLSGRLWECEGLAGYDAASMYPAMILLHKMPMSKFSYYGSIDSMKEFEDLIRTKACLFRVYLTDVKIKPRVSMPYIPVSKIREHGAGIRCDNGRLLACDWISITCNDIDWHIIDKQYEYDEIIVEDMHTARYGWMPEPIREQVMHYFRLKTELKDQIRHEKDPEKLENLKYLYAKAKQRLNAIFGMCYTDVIRPVISILDDGTWDTKAPNLDDALEDFYKNRNNFLVYAWGSFITSAAREHLQRLLDAFGYDNAIYCDTDSCKGILTDEVKQKIADINKEVIRKCEERKAYVDIGGERYYLGIFEFEGFYKKFITLGAKKYAYEDDEGFHITISGVEKKLGAEEMGSIDNFKPGYIFHKAAGRTLYYNTCEKHYIEVEGCRMLTASNIGMIDSTYELGITGEYAELLGLNVYKELK